MSSLNELIDSYLEKGFGSMNKNDFEVAIFNYLITERSKYRGKNNYELSILLRIPETKVKRLRYEAALKNGSNDEETLKRRVVELLGNVIIREDGKKIIFQVEDVLLKSYISSILKKHGCSCDGSFSPEIVAINTDDYQYLLKGIYPKNEYEALMKQIRMQKTFKTIGKILHQVAIGYLDGLGGKLCDLTISGITTLLKELNTK